jgi:hypothetical protein
MKEQSFVIEPRFKTYAISIGSPNEWGMHILCDTPSQAREISKALKFYYEHLNEPIDCLEIIHKNILIEKII